MFAEKSEKRDESWSIGDREVPIFIRGLGGEIILASDDMNNRETDRFISEDPYWNTRNMICGDTLGNTSIPNIYAIKQSSNLYIYAMNNPFGSSTQVDLKLNYRVVRLRSIQSAALGLAHEMGHGAQHLDGVSNEFFKNPTESNRSKLEAANLKTYETPIAKQLGEPVRKSYTDASGLQRMNNSTHYVTTHSYPWYKFWNWGKHYTKDHNAK